jgi:hypothetical protein
MKIITHNVCPPIPVRCADWAAYFDGDEEDGPCGHGATELDAIIDLFWQTTDASRELAARERMDELEAALAAADDADPDT